MALWTLNSHFGMGLLVICAFLAELAAHLFTRKQRACLFFASCRTSPVTQRILNIVLWVLDVVVAAFLAYSYLRLMFEDHDHFTNVNNQAITKVALIFGIEYGILWLIILANMVTVTLFGEGSDFESRAYFGQFIASGILAVVRVVALCIIGGMLWEHDLKLIAIFTLVSAALVFLGAVMYFFGAFFAWRDVSMVEDREDEGYTAMEDPLERGNGTRYSKKHPKPTSSSSKKKKIKTKNRPHAGPSRDPDSDSD